MNQMILMVFAAVLSPMAPQADRGADLEPGLTLRVYDIGRPLDRLAPMREGQTPNVDRLVPQLDLKDDRSFGGPADYFVVEAFGHLAIQTAGRYDFALTSDDGARLTIDGSQVILHDGLHAATTREGTLELAAGIHPFRVDMFENAGGAALTLSWRPPGANAFEVVPPEAFLSERGITRVVSPGKKVVLDGREHLAPGDGMPLDAVHPGWVIEDLRPEGFEPQVGAMAFLPDERLVIASFEPKNNGVLREEPNGTIFILDNVVGGGPDTITVTEAATGFHDPSGMVVVDGDIYISHRPDITRLRDLDGDGVFEDREVFVAPWISDNYHHFSFGLVEHAGWIYGTLSTSIYFENTIKLDGVEGAVVSMNGPNPPNRGTCYRVNIETREVEFLAGGFRTPNGLGVTKAGDIFVTDNQGAWLPTSKLIQVKPGSFYGHANGGQTSERYPDGGSPSLFVERGETPPTVWLPQNEVANSPTNVIEITEGPFAGQLLMGELTMGGVRRVQLDGNGGGAVFRHSQGFEGGINRIITGPDGCLYVGATGAGGNWTWKGTQFGLQRMRPTGETAFEIESMRRLPQSMEVVFTERVDEAWLADPANYTLTQWHYVATPQYGGPKHDERRLAVKEALLGGDGRSVQLVVDGLQAASVLHLRTDPVNGEGEQLWSREAWYTLPSRPTFDGGTARSTTRAHVAPLEGGDLARFADHRGTWETAGDVSMSEDNPARLTGAAGTGVAWNGADGRAVDLVTNFDHGDVSLHIEFMVPKGSNSGVYLMGRYEIQILDSFGKEHPAHDDCGGKYQRWDPGRGQGKEGYEGIGPRVNAARPAGEWQSFDIDFRAPRFDDAGNKVADAVFERVVHNGVEIHRDVVMSGPTRGGYADEVRYAPLRLQGDHGPIAYRNIWIQIRD